VEKGALLIGRAMTVGVALSVVFILLGGVVYLLQEGNQAVHYQTFQPLAPSLTTIPGILSGLFFSPLAWIQSGILILLMTQVVRVALTGLLFVRSRDVFFSGVSFFILGVLIVVLC
jgi:uncharacterized membrane protein